MALRKSAFDTPWPRLLLQWGSRLGAAAVLAAVLEFAGATLQVGAVTSDAAGACHLFVSLIALFSLAGLPIAMVGLFLDRRLSKGWWPDPTYVTAWVTGTLVTSGGLLFIQRVFAAFPANEFPSRTGLIEAMAVAAVTGAGVALSIWVLPHGWRRLWFHLPHLGRPRVVPTFLVLVSSSLCFFVAHFGLAPIHLAYEVNLAGWAGIALLVVAVRWAWVNLAIRPATIATVLWLAVCLFSLAISSRNSHARFMMFGHCPIASRLATGFVDLVDIDGDGAASTWLGGADCAEFDAGRGPANLEVPGDGIDQDCRGGDAFPPQKGKRSAGWSNCDPPQRPNVLLITIDALRADAVNPRVMPILSAFRDVTFDFRRAYSPTTQTPFSMASVFAGKPASDLGTTNMLVDRDLTVGRPLPARFRDAGYATMVFNILPLPDALTLGVDDVTPNRTLFDVYPGPAKLAYGSAGLTTAAIATLEGPRERPFFAWIHYPDLHAPYQSSSEWAPPGLTPYEREAAYVDFHLGRLLEAVRRLRLHENSLIVITADHGEDLGERGREGHGPDAYESAIHVPLLLSIPACQGRKVHEPVSLSRLGVTLAALSAVEMPGLTLLSDQGPDVPVVAEVVQVLDLLKRAVVTERYKLIVDVRHGGRVLFDLQQDPEENNNLYNKMPDRASALEDEYQKWLDSPGNR